VIRRRLLTYLVSGDVILAIAWAVGIALVFAPLAVRIYRGSVG
jgi:hypothetical protein